MQYKLISVATQSIDTNSASNILWVLTVERTWGFWIFKQTQTAKVCSDSSVIWYFVDNGAPVELDENTVFERLFKSWKMQHKIKGSDGLKAIG